MDPYETIKYKKNFLNQVIVRFDFQHFVASDSIFSDEMDEVIHTVYPNKGKKQIIRFNAVNVIVNAKNAEVKSANGESEEGYLCEYFTVDNKNKLILSNKYLVFQVDDYSSFENLMKLIKTVIDSFFENIKVAVTRIGIRYRNLFNVEKGKLRKNYFIPEISASLSTKNLKKLGELSLIRSMHTMEYREDQTKLNFRYGMFNPDYPNILENFSFTLDYDCYTEEIIENVMDMMQFLAKGHSAIQTLFEESITDSLRKVMSIE